MDHLHSLPASSFPAALTLLSLSSLRDEVLLHVCRVLLTDQLGYHRCVIYLHHAITPLLRSLATPMVGYATSNLLLHYPPRISMRGSIVAYAEDHTGNYCTL